MGKLIQLGGLKDLYLLHKQFPSESTVKCLQLSTNKLQQAPHRRHPPLRFCLFFSIYFLLNKNKNKRRNTPTHITTLFEIEIFLCGE